MATFSSDICSRKITPATSAGAGVVVNQAGTVSIPNTHAANDIIKLCKLPKFCLVRDFKLALDELDTNASATLAYTVGVLDSAGTGIVSGTELIVGGTSSAIGVQAMNVPNGIKNIGADDEDRIIAMKITNVAATKAAGTAVGLLSYVSE